MGGDHQHAEEVRRDGSHGNDPVDEPARRRRLVDGSHEQIRRERDEEHRHRVAAYLLRPLEHETVERQDDRGDRAGAATSYSRRPTTYTSGMVATENTAESARMIAGSFPSTCQARNTT